MARLQCNACGGTYDTVQGDGTLYFHACPPLSAAEIRAAMTAGTLVLPLAVTAAVTAAEKADAAAPDPKPSPSFVDRVLATFTIPRPNARNENIDVVKTARARRLDDKAPAQLVSLGADVTVLVPDP